MSAQASSFRLATSADTPSLRELLVEAALPADDVDAGSQEYVLALEQETLVGAVGIEAAGTDGLLRSLAVRSDRRGRGVATKLAERALALASMRGVGTVYLLTTTARDFFARLGFESVDRSRVPPLVSEHAQFRSLCPSTATCMRRRIDGDAHWLPRDLLALRPDVPGAAFWAVALERAMLTYFEVEPHARFERHSHEAEQITLVLEGELHFELDAGRVVRVGPGDVLALPSGVPHAAWAGTKRVRAVDAWSPPRRS